MPDSVLDLPGILFERESIRVFVPQKAFVLYRLFNVSGQLLYIGASASPRTRLLAHLRDEKPANYARLEFFRSSTAMAKAERIAIDNEPHLLPCGFGRRHAAWKARKPKAIKPEPGVFGGGEEFRRTVWVDGNPDLGPLDTGRRTYVD